MLNKFEKWLFDSYSDRRFESASRHIDSFETNVSRDDWVSTSLEYFSHGCHFIESKGLTLNLCLAIFLKETKNMQRAPIIISKRNLHEYTPPELILFRGSIIDGFLEGAHPIASPLKEKQGPVYMTQLYDPFDGYYRIIYFF